MSDGRRAVCLYGAAENWVKVGYAVWPDDPVVMEQALAEGLATSLAALGQESLDRARTLGRAMTLEQAVEHALAEGANA